MTADQEKHKETILERGVREHREQTEHLTALIKEHAALETAHAITLSEVEALRALNAKIMAERDHYMREATEHITKINDAIGVLQAARENHEIGLYRPNGHAPTVEVSSLDGEPPPRCVQFNREQDALSA